MNSILPNFDDVLKYWWCQITIIKIKIQKNTFTKKQRAGCRKTG